MAMWTVMYKRDKKSPWIETNIQANDSQSAWRAWDSFKRENKIEFHTVKAECEAE